MHSHHTAMLGRWGVCMAIDGCTRAGQGEGCSRFVHVIELRVAGCAHCDCDGVLQGRRAHFGCNHVIKRVRRAAQRCRTCALLIAGGVGGMRGRGWEGAGECAKVRLASNRLKHASSRHWPRPPRCLLRELQIQHAAGPQRERIACCDILQTIIYLYVYIMPHSH